MSDQDPVLYEVDGGVAVVTFNRPDRHNAWTEELGARYFDLLQQATDDPEVRAIVVTGAGRSFCPGADMQMLERIGDDGQTGQSGARDERPMTFPLTVPKPMIAAINGACAGLGLVHALMCDVRFAAEGAKLTTAFSRVGLIAEHGISWLLPRIVGTGHALDLLLSARPVPATEAAELGLVNRAIPAAGLMDETLGYARELTARVSPSAMAVIKQQVHAHSLLPLDAAREDSDRLMATMVSRPDFVEGVAAFQERRSPSFAPLDPDWAAKPS